MRYPLVSEKYRRVRYGPLAVSLSRVLTGVDGSFISGQVGDHMNRLLNLHVPFAGPDSYEIGCWDNQFAVVDDVNYSLLARAAIEADPPGSGSFYAWLDSEVWDYDPALVIYSEHEFRSVFLDACQNYGREHRKRWVEFDIAVKENLLL